MSTTLAKGLMVLETIVGSEHEVGVTEVAKSCGLTKEQCPSHVESPRSRGLLDPACGVQELLAIPQGLEMGNTAMAQFKLVDIAQETMRRLADETGEAIHLAVYDNQDTVTIAQIESRHAVRAYTQVGARSPAYTVARVRPCLPIFPTANLTLYVGRSSRSRHIHHQAG